MTDRRTAGAGRTAYSPETVWANPTLSLSARGLFSILAGHADRAGACRLRAVTIAEIAGICERQVRRLLVELRDSGHVTWDRTGRSSLFLIERDPRRAIGHRSPINTDTGHRTVGHSGPNGSDTDVRSTAVNNRDISKRGRGRARETNPQRQQRGERSKARQGAGSGGYAGSNRPASRQRELLLPIDGGREAAERRAFEQRLGSEALKTFDRDTLNWLYSRFSATGGQLDDSEIEKARVGTAVASAGPIPIDYPTADAQASGGASLATARHRAPRHPSNGGPSRHLGSSNTAGLTSGLKTIVGTSAAVGERQRPP